MLLPAEPTAARCGHRFCSHWEARNPWDAVVMPCEAESAQAVALAERTLAQRFWLSVTSQTLVSFTGGTSESTVSDSQ